jgi:hypothetical protein
MSFHARARSTASWLGLGALLLLGIFAWAPALHPHYWQTLQGFVPIFNAGAPATVAGIGVAPDLWRGAGSATYLLTQPWIILGQDPTTAVRLAFVLTFVIGGCAIYAWLRPVFGDLAGGLAGLVYVLQPIFLATVYVHGSLAHALVLAWLPLALAGLAGSARHRTLEGAAVAVLAIVALWRTQAGLAVPATLLLLAYAVLVERHWAPTLAVAAAAGAGFVTLLPHWAITAPPPVPFADHFVTVAQLLDVRWGAGPSTAGWQDRYPFQLGFAVLAFSALTLWLWLTAAYRRSWLNDARNPQDSLRRHGSGGELQARLLGFAFGGSLLLILLTLGGSAPLWQFSGAHRLLTYPWEILLLTAPLLAVTAGALPLLLPDLQDAALPEFDGPVYWFAVIALVVLASYPYLAPAYTTVQAPARPAAMFGANQLAVLSAKVTEADGAAVLDITWQVLQPLSSDDNIFFQAIAASDAEDADEQVVAQLDAQPLGADRPATTWQPGEILTARYTLSLPPTVPLPPASGPGAGAPDAGAANAVTAPQPTPTTAAAEGQHDAEAAHERTLRYYFGFYNWQTGARLPVDGGIDDKLVLYAD